MPSRSSLGGRPSRRGLDRSLPLAALLFVATFAAKRAPLGRAAAPDPEPPAVLMVAACEPLPGPAPDQPAALRATVGINLGNDDLAAPREDSVRVCLLVDSTGTVRDAIPLG